KPETAKRVLDAARDLGFDRRLPTLYRQGLRFEVVLGRRNPSLCMRISDAIQQSSQMYEDVVIQRTFLDENRPEAIAEAITKSRSNALVIFGQDHELIVEAIAEATAAGKPIVTILSDVPTAPRFRYVGINHYRAGRSAAFFLSRMGQRGRLLLVSSSLQYRSQAERISGCQDGIRAYAGVIEETLLVEMREGSAFFERPLDDALTREGIVAIYNVGVEHAALGRLLAERGLSPMLVGHDLDPTSRQMLHEGSMALVIDQNPDLQIHRALGILARRCGLDGIVTEEDPVVPFSIHIRDSIC
ncbi:substrate-binding domain-containing protein, partial [Thalassorhabdomicrobium marinisediminis]|uniref:substrate-binding domain-containing protein n=1 Tax=Thalassorhabdomicrobium marinisediminis TaxID=2170577 RepID=UPI002491D2BC